MLLYFAYGSNMDPHQLAKRCPSLRFVTVAQLPSYKLAFTRWSPKRNCGVADVVMANGSTVWGAVFELSDADIDELDRHEGAKLTPPAYRRMSVTVRTQEGEMLPTLTYEVALKSVETFKPSREYLALILRGAEHWRLPLDYIEELKRIEAQ